MDFRSAEFLYICRQRAVDIYICKIVGNIRVATYNFLLGPDCTARHNFLFCVHQKMGEILQTILKFKEKAYLYIKQSNHKEVHLFRILIALP